VREKRGRRKGGGRSAIERSLSDSSDAQRGPGLRKKTDEENLRWGAARPHEQLVEEEGGERTLAGGGEISQTEEYPAGAVPGAVNRADKKKNGRQGKEKVG